MERRQNNLFIIFTYFNYLSGIRREQSFLLMEQQPMSEKKYFPSKHVYVRKLAIKLPQKHWSVLEKGWNLESVQVLVHKLLTAWAWVSLDFPLGNYGINNTNFIELLGQVK